MDFWANKYPSFKTCLVSYMKPSSIDFASELESINLIYNEYEGQIIGGGVDLIKECMEKMNNSSLATIKENLKAQIDTYAGK